MAEKNPKKSDKVLREKISSIIRKTTEYTSSHQGARPFFPPPGLCPLIRLSNSPAPAHPAYPESGTSTTEPLDSASSAIPSPKTTSPVNAEASATSTETASPPPEPSELVKPFEIIRNSPPSPESSSQSQPPEPFVTVRPYKINNNSLPSPESPPPQNPRRLGRSLRIEVPPPSPESPPPQNPRRLRRSLRIEVPPPSPDSPPQLYPRYLGRSHRIEAPRPSPRKQSNPKNTSVSCFSEDELRVFVDMAMLLENAEAQNQLNESEDLLQYMEFPENLPDSPPPPYSIENTEPSESEQVPEPEKEKECIICKRFERLALQKDQVHLTWLVCKFYITSHMHDICSWEAAPDKPKSKFWLSLEYQQFRQNFDAEATKCLEELDISSLSTAVTLYLERFMQVLYNHTPLEQVYFEEKCEKQLKELQSEFQTLLTTREDVLKYLMYEKEGFRHHQCSSYKTAIEWIKECVQEVSDGLREFEINLENLHLGRLIWSNNE